MKSISTVVFCIIVIVWLLFTIGSVKFIPYFTNPLFYGSSSGFEEKGILLQGLNLGRETDEWEYVMWLEVSTEPKVACKNGYLLIKWSGNASKRKGIEMNFRGGQIITF